MTLDELLASDRSVFTVDEVYPLFRIGRGAAYEAVRRGEIPSIKFGRTIRVTRRALFELLGEHDGEDEEASAHE